MLRKVTRDGYGYSVVELNDVRHVLAVAVPSNGGDLQEQAHDALQTIQAVHDEETTRGSIVHQAVFVADPALIPACRTIINEFYGNELPATSYVIQPPCQGKLLAIEAIEAIGVGRGKAEVHIERFSDQFVRVTHNALSWVHCANVTPRNGVTGAYNQTVSSLSKLRGLLAKLDVGFDHVIRTWFYQGGIVADEGDTQRYKELNRARSAFFEGVEFLAGCQTGLPQPLSPYPASTGIGTEGRGLMLSCTVCRGWVPRSTTWGWCGSTSSGKRTSRRPVPFADHAWVTCRRSMPWPTCAVRNCWSRSRGWHSHGESE
ncbi:MAG: hypothetical protein ABSE84_21350 [Isosphaeraceae bacterium]|jgi:enamine deaminase RidA (YjgF/YER057c/UK114 family)